MEVGLRPAMFLLDFSVVNTYIIPLFPCVELFFSLGLTLGRVVLVEVTKKVIFKSYLKIRDRSNMVSFLQIGTVNSIYVYTLLAIL